MTNPDSQSAAFEQPEHSKEPASLGTDTKLTRFRYTCKHCGLVQLLALDPNKETFLPIECSGCGQVSHIDNTDGRLNARIAEFKRRQANKSRANHAFRFGRRR